MLIQQLTLEGIAPFKPHLEAIFSDCGKVRSAFRTVDPFVGVKQIEAGLLKILHTFVPVVVIEKTFAYAVNADGEKWLAVNEGDSVITESGFRGMGTAVFADDKVFGVVACNAFDVADGNFDDVPSGNQRFIRIPGDDIAFTLE